MCIHVQVTCIYGTNKSCYRGSMCMCYKYLLSIVEGWSYEYCRKCNIKESIDKC